MKIAVLPGDGIGPEIVAQAVKVKADFLALDSKLLSARLIQKAHQNNLPLWVWTVNSPKKIQKFMQIESIQAIITDVPDITISALSTTNPTPSPSSNPN